MKKFVLCILALCLCIMLATPVFATGTEDVTVDTPAENSCGEDMIWEFADGTLTISGNGSMYDFEGDAPWAAHKKEIKRLVLSGSISYIGARAFSNYDALETVNFGSALYEIGEQAFKSCDGLTVIYMPASFKIFREESMMGCSGLTAIHCSGRPLTFKLNSMRDTYCTIYYPADRPWSVDYIAQLEDAFHGRIEFLASDGTDHYRPEEATEPVTEMPTEEPTEAPTEAPTEPPTEPPTEAPTEPPTEAPTEETVTVPATPETLPAPEIPEATAPVADEKPQSKSWIGMVIIAAVAAFILLGMILVRAGSRRGRYSKKRRKR